MLVIDIVTISVALFALGWNIYRDVIQLPRIKIVLTYNLLEQECSSDKKNYIKFSVRIRGLGFQIVNIGRTDIYIKHMISKKKGNKNPPLIDWQNEAESIRLESGQEHIRERDNIHPLLLDGSLQKIGFLDTFGRKHWAPQRKLNKMIATMNNYPTHRYEEICE